MLAIKNLQASIHGHSITSINTLQTMKTCFEQSMKNEEIPEHQRHLISLDIRRIDVLIEWILAFGIMDDFYSLERNISSQA